MKKSNKVKELEAALTLAEIRLKGVEEEMNVISGKCSSITWAVLEEAAANARSRIRGLKRAIGWEESRYDYLKGYEKKLKELAPYLGKEVKSAFKSDKDTPQILLGLFWKDGEINYSSSHWVALIRYVQNGRDVDANISLDAVSGI